MKRIVLSVAFLFGLVRPAAAQKPEPKFIADTLVVEAEGIYETDPDLATLTFDVSSQDKELKRAYDNESPIAKLRRSIARSACVISVPALPSNPQSA